MPSIPAASYSGTGSAVIGSYLREYRKVYERFPSLNADLLDKFEEVESSPSKHTDMKLAQLCVRDFLVRSFLIADQHSYVNIATYVRFRDSVVNSPDEKLFDVVLESLGPLLDDQEVVKFEISLELGGRLGEISARHLDQRRVGDRWVWSRGLIDIARSGDFLAFGSKLATMHMKTFGGSPLSFIEQILGDTDER